MRVLFDQGTPDPLRQALLGHEVATAYERGWFTLKNGELLEVAEREGYEVFVTTDSNLKYQQNLAGTTCHRGVAVNKLAENTPCSRQNSASHRFGGPW
jgi:hypothetical protein